MSIATGDLLQLIDFQDYLGEQMLNVYYYRWSSAPTLDNSAYSPLIADFATNVINNAKSLQNDAVTHTLVQIKNLSNATDFLEEVNGSLGEITSTPDTQLPSYVSLGFQLIRDSLVTKSGYKRIGGLVDDQVEGNEFVGSTSDANNYALGVAAPLSIGILDVAFPVIPKRPIPNPAGTSYIYASIASAILKGLGTQNTRKKGRGA